MGNSALGIIETRGMVAAIQAVDTMVKAANVEVLGMEKIGSGLVTVMVNGDVGAVKAAVDAGSESAQKFGEVTAAIVIPKPHDDIGILLSKK